MKPGSYKRPSESLFFRMVRTWLAALMLLGNPAGLFEALSAGGLRLGLPAFAATLLLAGRLKAEKLFAHPAVLSDQTRPIVNLDPTDEDLSRSRLFDEPFYPTWVGGPNDALENHELAMALKGSLDDPQDRTLAHLEGYAQKFPSGRWVLSVELNRGIFLYDKGYFSLAMNAFRNAWNAGKNVKASGFLKIKIKDQTDRALAEWIRMDSRVGRKDEISKLLTELGPRKPEGKAARYYRDARDAIWNMNYRPGKAFFCGPYALQSILKFQHSPKAKDPLFVNSKSPQTGFSLDQVWGLSSELGMGYQMAKRKPGSKVIIPCVVNWKLNHYAAIVEQKNGSFHSVDPTFGNNTWLTQDALDEEASGYFLVPNGSLPEGWEPVGIEEASKVWGKGLTNGKEPQPPPCYNPDAACGMPTKPTDATQNKNCGSHGMPRADMDLFQAAAVMTDTPLSYKPSVGPVMDFTLSYNSETANPLVGSNFGFNWSFNWQGFIRYSYGTINNTPMITSAVVMADPSGGQETFPDFSAISKYTQSSLQVVGNVPSGAAQGLPDAIVRQLPDGSKEFYGYAIVGLTNITILLSQVTDRKGNTVNFNYDGQGRLLSIQDALGKSSSFSYGDVDPFKITQITDPFGRTAQFNYDANGMLQSITDQLQLTSSFTYGPPSALSSDWVGTMTTPYGTTTFDYGSTNASTGVNELELTDPLQGREHVLFRQPADQLSGELLQPSASPLDINAPIPCGMIGSDSFMYDRNTYFWSKKAMEKAPLSLATVKIYHWLHTPEGQQSAVPECIKNPLENRIWYLYEGQSTNSQGSFNQVYESSDFMLPKPIVVSRFTDSSYTQCQKWNYAYNNLGKPTNITDPKGRQTVNVYDPSGMDLVDVQDGLGEHLARFVYNSQHEVTTYTDMAGKSWGMGYNSAGQITSLQPPVSGETTSYNYDGQGQLTSVVPPQSGAQVSYTYDNVGRVQTRTDAVHGTISYQYDSGDRVTKVLYPDGTHESYQYDRLDIAFYTDRQSRTTQYEYDANRRLITVTDPKQQATRYGWCACGSLESITDPKYNSTRFDRDVQGNLVQKTYADGTFTSYSYDPAGRLSTVTDGNQQTTQYAYDLADSVTQVSYPGTTTHSVFFNYDPVLPRLTQMTDGTGPTAYSYYPIGTQGGGKVSSLTQPVGSTTATIAYSYDNDGRVVHQAIDGSPDDLVYQNAQIVSETNTLGGFTYGYDPASARLNQISFPNGQQTTLDYYNPGDPLGASGSLKDIVNSGAGNTANQTLSQFTYGYNPTGEIKTWSQTLGGVNRNYAMGYDPDSELAGVTMTSGSGGFDGLSPNQAVTYDYDAAGNRTLEKTATYSNSFGTNKVNQLTYIAPNPIPVKGATNRQAAVTVNGQGLTEDADNGYQTQITPSGGSSTPLTVVEVAKDGTVNQVKKHVLNKQPYTYDNNGNLVQDDQKAYTWDAANRLTSVKFLNPQPTALADTIQMAYDGLGRRVGITESHGSTVLSQKTFVWCGEKLCQERTANGSTVTKQFFSQGEQISGTNYYYTRDHLGSIRELTDSTGTVQARNDYDAWGRQTKLFGTMDADFGFTGFYQEKAAGLDLTWFRAYDAEKGRWLSRDPIGEFAGPNLYAYVMNNSFRFFDPFGLFWAELGSILLGALATAAYIAETVIAGVALWPVLLAAAAGLLLYSFFGEKEENAKKLEECKVNAQSLNPNQPNPTPTPGDPRNISPDIMPPYLQVGTPQYEPTPTPVPITPIVPTPISE